jgi:hypothetical protein
VHAHGGLDVMMAMALRRDLQADRVPHHAIVAANLAALVDAQDVPERPAGIGNESRTFLGGIYREAGVVVGHERLLEVAYALDRFTPDEGASGSSRSDEGSRAHDSTRSGKAFRLGLAVRRAGRTFDEFREAIATRQSG